MNTNSGSGMTSLNENNIDPTLVAAAVTGTSSSGNLTGGTANDALSGTSGNDVITGAAGADKLWGNAGNDVLDGGTGADLLVGGWGADKFLGGAGNDVLLARSDGGEPLIGVNPSLPRKTDPSVLGNPNDTLTGGDGADTFRFELTMNLDPKLAVDSKAVNADGTIDWMEVTHLNDDAQHGLHGHWMDAIGQDVITDFSKAQGDKIEIVKHNTSVSMSYGKDAGGTYSLVTLTGNQPQQVNAPHHLDKVGTIKVYGDKVYHKDIAQILGYVEPSGYETAADGPYGDGIDTGVLPYSSSGGHMSGGSPSVQEPAPTEPAPTEPAPTEPAPGDTATPSPDGNQSSSGNLTGGTANDALSGTSGNDVITGAAGADKLWGNAGNDVLDGGTGADLLVGGWGADKFLGGAGNDVLLARSDGGEPLIGVNPSLPRKTDPSVLGNPNDTLTGGDGADTFRFELTMNLDPKLAVDSKAVNADGTIDWMEVTHLNDDAQHGLHGHWMDAIGQDVITDFSKAQGDKIEIVKHNTSVSMSYGKDAGGTYSLVTLTGNQPQQVNAPHHLDKVGTIKVYGDKVYHKDIAQILGYVEPSGYETAADGPYGDGIDTGVLPYSSSGGHMSMASGFSAGDFVI